VGQGCGGVINQTSGTIQSLDYDGDGQYENSLDCRWTKMAAANSIIVLNFTAFNLEPGDSCPYDYVEVGVSL
jgi:hypothetical protein